MGVIDESIARRANRKGNCTGRFREKRFHSPAPLDEGTSVRYGVVTPP